jgi:SAM-dependent methyltransferase
MSSAPKRYDRAYFDRWYRNPRSAVVHRGVLARRVQFAVAAAEYLLERPIRRVLDVGCGEAPWRALLKLARPGVRYTGVDSSAYAVGRFGRRRNVILGRFGDLGRLGLRGRFDLIVCSDVLHYVSTPEAGRGLKAMARLLGGLAWIEVFTAEDDTVGDDVGFQPRRAAGYRRLFRAAGLVPLGLHCYVTRKFEERLTTFESGG